MVKQEKYASWEVAPVRQRRRAADAAAQPGPASAGKRPTKRRRAGDADAQEATQDGAVATDAVGRASPDADADAAQLDGLFGLLKGGPKKKTAEAAASQKVRGTHGHNPAASCTPQQLWG
jgi:hypothetical protein